MKYQMYYCTSTKYLNFRIPPSIFVKECPPMSCPLLVEKPPPPCFHLWLRGLLSDAPPLPPFINIQPSPPNDVIHVKNTSEMSVLFKGTVSVISSELPFKNWFVRYKMILFKPLSDYQVVVALCQFPAFSP